MRTLLKSRTHRGRARRHLGMQPQSDRQMSWITAIRYGAGDVPRDPVSEGCRKLQPGITSWPGRHYLEMPQLESPGSWVS